jgi:outer membrane scaffolding protein for murein synthesis (MipA/OmpV family)
MLSYQFTDNLSAALSGSYSILPGEVKDSPIVDRSHLWSAGFGIQYKF